MEKIKGYDEVPAFTGEFEKLKEGGHVCQIKDAKVEKSKNGNDMMIIEFDIVGKDDENADYYQRRFENAKQFDIEAKWPGTHRIMLEDKEGNCNKFFKGFITSVEASNKGYKFNWDEKTLKDKIFGGIFGKEQYVAYDGTLKFSTKLRYIRSTEKINEAEIPEDKLLNNKNTTDGEFITIDENEPLPF